MFFTKKVLRRVSKKLQIGITGLLLSSLFGATACAYGLKAGAITYEFFQNGISPSYKVALDAMQNIYKNHPEDPNPLIGIAEVDLNGDKMPELIALPTEEYEQQGFYCDKTTTLCPHYVLEIRGDRVHSLGVIHARMIDRADTTKDGYWQLKVFTKGEKDPSYFETYSYSPKSDGYVRHAQPSPSPTPQKP